MTFAIKQYPTLKDVRNGKITMIILIILAISFLIYSNYLDKSLRKNLISTKGIVTEVKYASKHGYQAYYTFDIRGRLIESSINIPNFKNDSNRHILTGRVFPVIVDSNDLTHSKMLFDSLSFINYGLTYPDSLKWLLPYLK